MASEELFTAELSEELTGKQDDKDEIMDALEEEPETIVEIEVGENEEIIEAVSEGNECAIINHFFF